MSDDSNNTTGIAIAVMQEQLKTLIEDSKEARHARKNAYMVNEKRDEMLIRIEHRLEKVEAFILGASPTLAEFNALKLKAQGAGALGKAVWIAAGAIIGVIAAMSGWIGRIFEGIR